MDETTSETRAEIHQLQVRFFLRRLDEGVSFRGASAKLIDEWGEENKLDTFSQYVHFRSYREKKKLVVYPKLDFNRELELSNDELASLIKRFPEACSVTGSACLPTTSFLDNVEENFIKYTMALHFSYKCSDSFFVNISPEMIIFNNAYNNDPFLSFKKTSKGCEVIGWNGSSESHSGNYLDLSITTLVRIFRSNQVDIRELLIVKQPTTSSETWIEFMKTFCSLRTAINQTNLGFIILIFQKWNDYRVLKDSVDFSTFLHTAEVFLDETNPVTTTFDISETLSMESENDEHLNNYKFYINID